MRLGKTTIVNLVGQVIVSVSGFVATFAIAVLGGSSTLGTYAIAVSLGSFFLIIPAQAIERGTRKRMSERQDPGSFLGVGLLLNSLLAVGTAATILLVGWLLNTLSPASIEIVSVLTDHYVEIAVLVLASTAFRTVRGAIQGDKRVGESGLLLGGERVLRSVFQVTALVLGFGVGMLIVGHSLAVAIAAVAGYTLVTSSVERPTRAQIRSVLDYAKYAWLGTLRTRVYGWLDTFVLSFFVSASLIGIYEAAWGIATLLGIVGTAIRQTLFPEMSELSVADDYDQIRNILDDGLVFSGVFVIPGLLGSAVIGQRVLRFYSREFGQGAEILLILIGAYIANVYGSQFVNVLNAIDRPEIAYRVNGLFIAVSIVLNVSLVWAYGWYGAAVATAGSSAVRTGAAYASLRLVMDDVPLPFAEVGRQVLAAAGMAGLVYPVVTLVPPGRLGTILLVAYGAVVYLAFLFALSERVRHKSAALAPEWVRYSSND